MHIQPGKHAVFLENKKFARDPDEARCPSTVTSPDGAFQKSADDVEQVDFRNRSVRRCKRTRRGKRQH